MKALAAIVKNWRIKSLVILYAAGKLPAVNPADTD